jgi:DnaJ-domain-containing protein 1
MRSLNSLLFFALTLHFCVDVRSYHPDMQRDASDAEKARAEERSKIISESYRKLKESQR